jgi:methylated-DNA-[protein]-cysteine S-methyltransferase
MIKEYCSVVKTPIGELSIFAEEAAVYEVSFIKAANPSLSENVVSQQAAGEFYAYFEGSLKSFTFLQQQRGTAFQQGVWNALTTIPYGTTLSYAALADQLLNPKAIRAIAAANGRNNLAIIIPCHRVIGSSGKLVGYAGELWRKNWLLNHEREIAQAGQMILKF